MQFEHAQQGPNVAPPLLTLGNEWHAAVHVMDGVPQTLFAKVAFVMATSDAERIAVNAAASSVPSGGGNDSALTQHYTSLHSALAMLSERTQMILEYCKDMEAGNTPVNHQVCSHHSLP